MSIVRSGLLAAVALAGWSTLAAAAGQFPTLILIDEDSIDNSAPAILELAAEGACGGGNPASCVNDQSANPGVRDPLNIPEGTIIGIGPGGTSAMLFTGQDQDWGWWAVPTIPASWVAAGPTGDGAMNFILATAPGFGNNGEFLLDQIPDVNPLDAAELAALVGQTVCAVVYDSDISFNNPPPLGNLQGATLGVIALEVLAVGVDPPGSVLPDITVLVKSPDFCGKGVTPVRTSTWGNVKATYR
jgi:hypothetical protein